MGKKNKYYVYVYLDPRKPGQYSYSGLPFSFLYEPFYVGKGKDERDKQHLLESKRASTIQRNLHKNNKINSIFKDKFQPLIIRIYENLTENISLNLEIFIIKKIGRHDIKTGPLCNHTNGGESIKGYIFTDEVKLKMSESQKNSLKHATRGKKLSETHKLKISKSITGINNPMYKKAPSNKNKKLIDLYGQERAIQIREKLIISHIGHKHSKDTKIKMSLSQTGKKKIGNFKGQPKTYKFINPNGLEFIVTGKFENFCKENNLPIYTFKRIVQNKRNNKFWNKWTVKSIN